MQAEKPAFNEHDRKNRGGPPVRLACPWWNTFTLAVHLATTRFCWHLGGGNAMRKGPVEWWDVKAAV